MKFISWNIRGQNGAHKQEIVRNMISDQRPNFLLIQETKMKKDMVGKLSLSSSIYGEAIDSEGVVSDLLMFFNNKAFKISTIYNEGNALLCNVFHIHSRDSWFLLNVYAPNSKRERRDFWDKILCLIQSSNLKKGIIMGDFNTPLSDEEKS